jgi:hypothetical protein
VRSRYRKRPVEVEAVLFTGRNDEEVLSFIGDSGFNPSDGRPTIAIRTLEGTMTAEGGDWIVRGVKGEFYPVKPDIFAATYEPVEATT